MTRDYIGGFGGGFVDGLGAGAQFASQFQEADQLDREQRQSSEMAEKWKKLREDQDANAAATQSDLASLAQPTPAAAPSVQPPPSPSATLGKPAAPSFQDHWNEATEQDGPPDTHPMDAAPQSAATMTPAVLRPAHAAQPTLPAVASRAAPAPAPVAAPAAEQPKNFEQYWAEAGEPSGPPDVAPMSDATRAAMPAQVKSRAPGNGIGAGFAAVHAQNQAAQTMQAPAAAADGAPRMVKTSMPASAPAGDSGGLLEPGNIDLTKRPVVKNPDSSISTVRSMSVGMDGKEYLIPTVADDGSRILSDEEAIKQFQRTGKHLGAFDTPEHATAYADTLHNDQARMYAPTAPAAAPQPSASSPAGVAPAPVSVNELGSLRASGDQPPAAKKGYTIDDFQNDRIQSAARLGLADEVNKGIAESISRKYNTAAMKALYAGDYNEVFRLHNLLPDGYSVKREVVPAGTDGSPGGVKLTMVNDKTGQVYGQPQTFASDKEAAGAMVEGAQKNLSDWLYKNMTLDAKHRELNLTDKLRRDDLKEREWYHGRVTDNQRAAVNQKYDAVDARYANGGYGSGSRGGKSPADSLDYTKYSEWVAGKDGSGGVSTWAPTGYRTYRQILDNNPLLAASEGGKALALEMSANVARTNANPDAPAQAPGMANYRVLPMLKQDGTWAAGVTDENGRAYYLENNINPASLIRKDKDGKAVGGIDDAWVKQREVGFMQNYAKTNPDRFKQLTAAASNPEDLRKMAALAQADPSKQADLRIMQMAQKYGANLTAPAPAAAPAAPAAPRQIFTPTELQDAKALGVTPTTPLATRLGNAWEGVKSAVSSATDFSPESFGRYVANARRSGRFDADAQLMMAAMQRNPALAKQLTPQELNAVQVAANKRL